MSTQSADMETMMSHRSHRSIINRNKSFQVPWVGETPTTQTRREYMKKYFLFMLYLSRPERDLRRYWKRAEENMCESLFKRGWKAIPARYFEWLVDEGLWRWYFIKYEKGLVDETHPPVWPWTKKPEDVKDEPMSVTYADFRKRELEKATKAKPEESPIPQDKSEEKSEEIQAPVPRDSSKGLYKGLVPHVPKPAVPQKSASQEAMKQAEALPNLGEQIAQGVTGSYSDKVRNEWIFPDKEEATAKKKEAVKPALGGLFGISAPPFSSKASGQSTKASLPPSQATVKTGPPAQVHYKRGNVFFPAPPKTIPDKDVRRKIWKFLHGEPEKDDMPYELVLPEGFDFERYVWGPQGADFTKILHQVLHHELTLGWRYVNGAPQKATAYVGKIDGMEISKCARILILGLRSTDWDDEDNYADPNHGGSRELVSSMWRRLEQWAEQFSRGDPERLVDFLEGGRDDRLYPQVESKLRQMGGMAVNVAGQAAITDAQVCIEESVGRILKRCKTSKEVGPELTKLVDGRPADHLLTREQWIRTAASAWRRGATSDAVAAAVVKWKSSV